MNLLDALWCQGFRCGHLEARSGSYDWTLTESGASSPFHSSTQVSCWVRGYHAGAAARAQPVPEHIKRAPLPETAELGPLPMVRV